MSNVNSKEYLKKYINNAIQGKIGLAEVQSIKHTLMNYSREEWKELLAVSKELAAEVIDQEMAKAKSENIPEHWKAPLKDYFNSVINIFLAVLNEEVWYQAMLIEKEGGTNRAGKINPNFANHQPTNG
ncbi:MAG: hypothetical protein I3273_00665 [Candidatus Moeniiplasma glomeromycotorum]|nr:hypothetical protein [Candidatus Moeniiplasma glomeromycotorum]MCE8167364.1 hypothetical protein [Candidatus Moeniiplasma glomeromycotorum]MCE8168623.1 hypothetical protein [Candidatus Moeniiplasma glomeromycotorum]